MSADLVGANLDTFTAYDLQIPFSAHLIGKFAKSLLSALKKIRQKVCSSCFRGNLLSKETLYGFNFLFLNTDKKSNLFLL